MSGDPSLTFNRILPAQVFQQISLALQKTALDMDEQTFVFSEANFYPGQKLKPNLGQRFLLVASRSFSALLKGVPWSIGVQSQAEVRPTTATQTTTYQTELIFEPGAIATFLRHLQAQVPADQTMAEDLEQAHFLLHPNRADYQSQFTLQLVDILSPAPESTPSANCVMASLAVQHPAILPDQEQVFTQVATQIRQTQELSQILETAVHQVCAYLQADRLIIYQFEPGASAPQALAAKHEALTDLVCGRITYEARANSSIPRILHLSEGTQCFIGVPDYREKYRQGATQAIADIHATYSEAPCLIEFLEWAHIRAKLVVPIVVREDLWGLLIAHQCSGPRQWLDSETRFMRCIAELLAIAIYQTQLYGDLQQQAQTLEQRVVERTQALRDTLTAAQTASLAKTEFLAAMSHELRTPLTAIIGMAATLLRLSNDSRRDRLLPPEKQQDYLKIIRNSGEHLLELINDILDLSQLEAGRTILNVKEFSLFQLASESLNTLRDKAEQNNIHLELDLKLPSHTNRERSIEGDRFAADPRRVKQILFNLLSNAIKFTPEGGQVILRVWIDHGKAFLQVEDTGIGIPESQFPLLFQKFQQLDTSYHRQYGGTGLGLALTKQLVELHGGHIEVESTVNRGSTFTVLLPPQPLTSRKGDVKPAESLTRFQRSERRIILIERYETTAHLLCDLLTASGHQVIWMVDGMTALQQIEILKPEVVIVSTDLPGMGTSEILQHLRQKNGSQPLKVLVSATTEDGDRDRWLAAGADDCITLPILHPETVLDQVTSLE